MPPAAVTNTKYAIKHKVADNASQENKRNSLEGGGPLRVGADQYFAMVLADTGKVVTLASGEKEVQLHYVEYCVLLGMEWTESLLRRNLCWYI